MSETIVLIENSSPSDPRFKLRLAALGYEVRCLSTSTAALPGVWTGVSVVVNLVGGEFHFETLEKVLDKDGLRLPVLYVSPASHFNPGFCDHEKMRDWIDVESPDALLSARVGTLVERSRLKSELASLQELDAKFSELDRRLKSLDTDAIVREAIDFFGAEFSSENVIWFPPGVLRRELESLARNRNATPGNARVFSRSGGQAWRQPSRDEMEPLFEGWCILTVAGVRLENDIQEITLVDGMDVVIPVAGGSHDRVLGHLVLCRPRRWSENKMKPLFLKCMQRFAWQLDQGEAYGAVQNLTYKDDLTELYNQRYLPMILDQELNRASRGSHQFSVLFLDVDFFKMVNDTKGHMVGSKVLVELSKLFKSSIRSTDFAFRYGGDEYVIVLSGASSKNALQVAERLRRKTAETTFAINGEQVKVTVSVGISTYPEHARSTEELLNLADEAMYVGKNKSRNIVYLAS